MRRENEVETISVSFYSFIFLHWQLCCQASFCECWKTCKSQINKQTNTQTMFRLLFLFVLLLLLLQVNNWHNGKCQRHPTTTTTTTRRVLLQGHTQLPLPAALKLIQKCPHTCGSPLKLPTPLNPLPASLLTTPQIFFCSWNILHICLAGQQKPQTPCCEVRGRKRVCKWDRLF